MLGYVEEERGCCQREGRCWSEGEEETKRGGEEKRREVKVFEICKSKTCENMDNLIYILVFISVYSTSDNLILNRTGSKI